MTAMMTMASKAGMTRMPPMPLVMGSMMSGDRHKAMIIGGMLHYIVMGTVVFGIGYALLFQAFGSSAWPVGVLIGVVIWQHGAPGGESPAAVTQRTDRMGRELLEICVSGGDVLVFGHGHGLTALTIRWLGLPIENGRHLRLGTGSVSTLGWKRDVRVLVTWNDRHHLQDA